MAKVRRRSILLLFLVPLALAVVGGVAWSISDWNPTVATLHPHLLQRGRIVVVGELDSRGLSTDGTELVAVGDFPEVADALRESDGLALRDAMSESSVAGILVPSGDITDSKTVEDRLRRYEHVEGLRAEVLDPVASLYLADDLASLSPPLDDVVAHVARELLAGRPPPSIASFPEPLRRVRNVEVMVMLRRGGVARLWRSARGSSVARALITASVVARQRWDEREQAMGRPLDEVLSELTVEVLLLQEDGTLLDRSRAFVDAAFKPEHGVAYERRGAWRYTLPTPENPPPSAYDAYTTLLVEHGLEVEALGRSDLRVYRLVATLVARSASSGSPGSPESRDGADGLPDSAL